MGNIFKVFFSISCLIIISSCDVFLAQKKDTYECESHIEEVYENTPLNNFEQTKFKDLFENRFPKYKAMFEKASEETSIDTNLLAAISFQESQWDPRAKSNMGVRGMMMVTLETAALVGVEKRLNPEQNIMGGAKYLAMLQERNVYGKTTADQLSISLAKYNLGPTNVINIAKEIGKEPDEITWPDLESELKNISGEDVNLVDVNGYSRGQQAIDYVNRIKNYYKLLAAHSCTHPKDQLTFF
ncbi:transglycosylase SLT domain-containing protein [Gammaproteobacteria bacterium]|nr:transglycosylase SLT domain-containing protein [Gammaproteobacteria bacterium]